MARAVYFADVRGLPVESLTEEGLIELVNTLVNARAAAGGGGLPLSDVDVLRQSPVDVDVSVDEVGIPEGAGIQGQGRGQLDLDGDDLAPPTYQAAVGPPPPSYEDVVRQNALLAAAPPVPAVARPVLTGAALVDEVWRSGADRFHVWRAVLDRDAAEVEAETGVRLGDRAQRGAAWARVIRSRARLMAAARRLTQANAAWAIGRQGSATRTDEMAELRAAQQEAATSRAEYEDALQAMANVGNNPARLRAADDRLAQLHPARGGAREAVEDDPVDLTDDAVDERDDVMAGPELSAVALGKRPARQVQDAVAAVHAVANGTGADVSPELLKLGFAVLPPYLPSVLYAPQLPGDLDAWSLPVGGTVTVRRPWVVTTDLATARDKAGPGGVVVRVATVRGHAVPDGLFGPTTAVIESGSFQIKGVGFDTAQQGRSTLLVQLNEIVTAEHEADDQPSPARTALTPPEVGKVEPSPPQDVVFTPPSAEALPSWVVKVPGGYYIPGLDATPEDEASAREWPPLRKVVFLLLHSDPLVSAVLVGGVVVPYTELVTMLAQLHLPPDTVLVLGDCRGAAAAVGPEPLAALIQKGLRIRVIATPGDLHQLKLTPQERAAGMRPVMTSESDTDAEGMPLLTRPNGTTVGPDWYDYPADGSAPTPLGPNLEDIVAELSAVDGQKLAAMRVARDTVWHTATSLATDASP